MVGEPDYYVSGAENVKTIKFALFAQLTLATPHIFVNFTQVSAYAGGNIFSHHAN